ncbi:MAG: SUMF1/EgtB/PvdO family nonheme iron enzyme [Sedimentisphaerales bacterium]|nr:SUMF1/EgtB/PvdO family nonheme iron enzyme [Sedimentisphaerales bacterium]
MQTVIGWVLVWSVLGGISVFADCPSADLTRDCYVDLADLAVLSQCWLQTYEPNSLCERADLFASGSVDIDDLLIMISAWQTGNRLPADMVVIPGGTFQMGDNFNEGWPEELPVHTVTLDSFAMGKYEITNGQYRDFLNSAKSQGLITVTSNVVYQAGSGTSYPYCGTSAASSSYSQIVFSNNTFSVRTKSRRNMTNDPMVDVSWYGSVAYCNWRSQQEGKQTCYNLSTWNCDFSKKGYRLATEAEWEYAARGGLSGKRFPWGDTINQTQVNFYSSDVFSYDVSPDKNQFHPLWTDETYPYPYTSPVGFFDGTLKYKSQYNWPGSASSYQTASGANGYGLYDMAGNIWEWCNDWWDSYSSVSQTNPSGPSGPGTGLGRVLRGGGWYGGATYCRVAYRPHYFPHGLGLYGDVGFRVVLSD